MTLLEEIQNAAVDSNTDLGTLLRKCKVLAADLGSKRLEDWLIWESNGYPNDIDVPVYRKWRVILKGNFSGPLGSGLRNVPIPNACLPKKLRERFSTYQCRQSIAGIEQLWKRNENRTHITSVGDLALALGTDVYEELNCLEAWGEFAASHLYEVLNSVRNRILDFTLAIVKERSCVTDSDDSIKAIKPSRITQIFNTTVYGGSANIVGSAIESSVVFEIQKNDFISLRQFLSENGVNDEDIIELKKALDVETGVNTDSFGPRVSDWIGKMIKKAASGAWTVSLGAAGSLLARAIGSYYGLQ